MQEPTRSSVISFDWADFKRSVVPYIERSVSGPWLRRYVLCAILFWLGAAMLSLFATHSSSPVARDMREFYRLESDSRDVTAWEQCGLCALVDRPKEAQQLRDDLAKISDKRLRECALEIGENNKFCTGIPWRIRTVLRDLRDLKGHAYNMARRSTERDKLDESTLYADLVAARDDLNFRPRVEVYRSPLDWSDFPVVLGLTCSFFLLFGAIVVVPFRVVVMVGRELYHQTWMLLVATQQPVSRILFALVLQALVPLALIGMPLLFTALLTMSIGGQVVAALTVALSLITLCAVWSAFGVTLAAMAGRHVAPSFLTLASLFVSGIYFLVVLGSGEFVANSSSDMLARLWMHSGLDFWAGAQAGFDLVSPKAQRYWSPNFARIIAQLALIPCCLLWIAAHAHRCQPGRFAGLTRRAWVGAWALAGLVLGARCFAGASAAQVLTGDFGDWSWRGLGIYAITALVVPLTSYLTTSAHPLSHRPLARVDLRTWRKTSAAACFAVGALWLGQVAGIGLAGACEGRDLFSSDGLFAAVLLGLWCVLMSGVGLLLARGLRSQRSKLEFFGASLLGMSLVPALIFACTARDHRLRHDSTFSVPSFVGFEFLLYLIAVGIVAFAIRRTRPKTKAGS